MNCRNCADKKTKLLFKKDDFIIYRCSACGLIFSDKLYLNNQIQEIYSDSYYKVLKNFSPITDKRYFTILDYLSRYGKDNRLLDIGCGAGQFLLAAKRKGWDVLGVEISRGISQWVSENLRLDIRCGDLLEVSLNKDYFDAITMFESLEHLNSPIAYLNKINLVLKNGGIFFLTTPNFCSLSRRLLGKRWKVFSREHLFYFSPSVLKHILEDRGFRVIKCMTKNISPLEFKNAILRHKGKNQYISNEEKLREQIENSNVLKLLKNIINNCLNLFKLGDSIWIFAQKIREIK